MRVRDIKSMARFSLKDKYIEGLVVLFFAVGGLVFLRFVEIFGATILSSENLSSLIQTDFILDESITRLIFNLAISVVGVVISTPFIVGAIWWYMQNARNEDNPNDSIFKIYTCFRLNLRAVGLGLLIWLGNIFMIIPIILCAYGIRKSFLLAMERGQGNFRLVLIIIGFFVLGLILTLLYASIIVRMTVAPFIFVRNPNLSAFKIVYLAIKGTSDSRGVLYRLFLSFALWIPIFPFVLPYLLMSVAKYTEHFVWGESDL